jgi:hypothetical protein
MKTTQKHMAFYKLYTSREQDRERYVPTWECVGEMYIEEVNEWCFMSYKCPARLSDLYNENPNLLERKELTGKSGSKYYGYRIRLGVSVTDIENKDLLKFYKTLKTYRKSETVKQFLTRNESAVH